MGIRNRKSTESYIKANKDDMNLVWHASDASYADYSFLLPGCALKFCYAINTRMAFKNGQAGSYTRVHVVTTKPIAMILHACWILSVVRGCSTSLLFPHAVI